MAFAWAAFVIALVHTLSPVHWLPYVAAAKSGGWRLPRLIAVTLLGATVHLGSTLILALLAVLLSHTLTHNAGHLLEWAGAVLLLALSFVYLFAPDRLAQWNHKLGWFLAVAVGIQPCVELIPLMLVAVAGGTRQILETAVVWSLTTMLASVAAVSIAHFGLGRWAASNRVERNVQLLAGLALFLSAILALAHTH